MAEQSEQEKPQLLVADDSKVVRKSISKMLKADYEVIEAVDGQEAWEILQQNDEIRLLFSDLGMPRMDGYELLEAVRKAEDESLAEIPVIIVTGKEHSEEEKEKLVDLGATDLITKPFDSAEVRSRTRSYINLVRRVKKLEQASPIDKRTGLATPDHFAKQTEIGFSLAKRHGYDITLARINIENFNALMEEHGKTMMARIVATVSKLLKNDMRKEDLAVYLENGKFATMLPCADPDSAEEVMERIRTRLEKVDLRIGEKVAHVAFSAGIVCLEAREGIEEFPQLMALAEETLQQAMSKGHEQTVTLEPAEVAIPEQEKVEIQIDELLQLLADGDTEISNEQYTQAMKKFLPLLARADKKLQLGLGKVVLHLHHMLKKA